VAAVVARLKLQYRHAERLLLLPAPRTPRSPNTASIEGESGSKRRRATFSPHDVETLQRLFHNV
jgi:hypothetical protein